jgi:hypothetical protein
MRDIDLQGRWKTALEVALPLAGSLVAFLLMMAAMYAAQSIQGG